MGNPENIRLDLDMQVFVGPSGSQGTVSVTSKDRDLFGLPEGLADVGHIEGKGNQIVRMPGQPTKIRVRMQETNEVTMLLANSERVSGPSDNLGSGFNDFSYKATDVSDPLHVLVICRDLTSDGESVITAMSFPEARVQSMTRRGGRDVCGCWEIEFQQDPDAPEFTSVWIG